jgi:hypothetical protein
MYVIAGSPAVTLSDDGDHDRLVGGTTRRCLPTTRQCGAVQADMSLGKASWVCAGRGGGGVQAGRRRGFIETRWTFCLETSRTICFPFK